MVWFCWTFAVWMLERTSLADGLVLALSVTRASRGCVIFFQFVLHDGPSCLVMNGESAWGCQRFPLTCVQLCVCSSLHNFSFPGLFSVYLRTLLFLPLFL